MRGSLSCMRPAVSIKTTSKPCCLAVHHITMPRKVSLSRESGSDQERVDAP